MSKRLHVLVLAVLLGSLLILAACGGGTKTTETPAAPVVAITVTPTTSTISVTGTAQLTAAVTGSTNVAVTWSVTPAGTVVGGLFTPPLKAGTYTVKATSQADATKSASATITVTAPAPEITSTAVTEAFEGTGYTYTVEATDPADTAVTVALTTAPEGATIDGNTISWTPSAAQGRVPNMFTVTATTDAGGRNTQSWTVVPAGIIRGSYIDKYWTSDGSSVDVPQDLTGWGIYAEIPQGDGSAVELEGTGNPDGTFTIADVPAGHYWLLLENGAYWTDSSTFDYGSDFIGRPYDPEQEITTTLNFNLVGLNPIYECCSGLEFMSPNAGVSYYTNNSVDYNTTVFNFLEGPLPFMSIDPTKDDASYVLQWDRVDRASGMALKARVSAVTSGLALDSLVTNPDGSTETLIEGQMASSPKAFDFNIKGSEWAKTFITAGPGLGDISPFMSSISSLPFVTDKFAYMWDYGMFGRMKAGPKGMGPGGPGGIPVADMYAIVTNTDQDLGAFRYVNPFPASWKPVFSAQQFAIIPVYVPGSDMPAYMEVGSAFMTHDMPNGPVAPIMSNVQNPKIGDKDFFAPGTIDNTTVAISWDAPTGLAPFGYRISIFELYDGDDYWYGDLYTSGTSVTIPQGFLYPGSSYAFMITAMADARAQISTSPRRSALPMADSSIVSGPLTVSGGEEPTLKFAARARASRMSKALAMTTPGANAKGRLPLRSFTKIQTHEPAVTK